MAGGVRFSRKQAVAERKIRSFFCHNSWDLLDKYINICIIKLSDRTIPKFIKKGINNMSGKIKILLTVIVVIAVLLITKQAG